MHTLIHSKRMVIFTLKKFRMEYQKYINEKKHFYEVLIDFIDNQEDDVQGLSKINRIY